MKDIESHIKGLENSREELKRNQKLIMDCLNGCVPEKELKVVKWAYDQRFKKIQHELQLTKKKGVN